MSVYTFKVRVSFNKLVLGIFYHRSDGSFKRLQKTLFQRYGVLAAFKVTWIDNVGDIITIFNDDDLSVFEKLKGAQVFVNAENDFIAGKIPDLEKPRSLSSLSAGIRDRSAELLVKNLEFGEDISEEERQFYVKTYPNVNMVAISRLHCTTCSTHIGSAVASEKTIRMHPVLRVTHCEKCHTLYNIRDLSKEYESEVYCRWCGQCALLFNPGFHCSKCPNVFCGKCIVRHLPRETVDEIKNNDNWSCFSCSPIDIWRLRAQHWALVNYIEKTKKKILSEEKDENKIYELMNKDLTLCCQVTKSVQLKGIQDKSTVLPKTVTPPVQQVEVQKEAKQSGVVDFTLEEPTVVTPVPVTSKANTSQLVAAIKPLVAFGRKCQKPLQITELPSSSQTVPTRNDQLSAVRQSTQSPFYVTVNGVQCDLNKYSELLYKLQSGTIVKIKKETSVNQATNSAKPTVPIPNDQLSQTQAKPSLFNINVDGFVVNNVNEACQQAKYTLQNGKFIRVIKETYIKQASPTNSANRSTPEVQSGSNNIFPNAHIPPLTLPLSIPPIPRQSQPVHRILHDHSHSEQYRLQMSNMRYRMNKTWLDAFLKRAPVAKNPNATSEVVESRFEHHLQRVRDVCQQIEDEVIYQMKSHKSVRNSNNVQELPVELHNELSILYTLSIYHFRRLQVTLANDMTVANTVANHKNKFVPVDNDVEVVEPTAEFIVADSDDENRKCSLQLISQDSQPITSTSVDEATFESDANFKLSTQSVAKTTTAEIDEKSKTRPIVILQKDKSIEERLKAFMQNKGTLSLTPFHAPGSVTPFYAATKESIESEKERVNESERQSNIDAYLKLSTQSVAKATIAEIDEKSKTRPIVILQKDKSIEERLKAFMQNKGTRSVTPLHAPGSVTPFYAVTKESIESGSESVSESERQSNIDADLKLSTQSVAEATITEIDEKLKTRSIVVLKKDKMIEERLKAFMQNESTGSVTPNSDELLDVPDEFVNNSPKEPTRESIKSGKEPVNESEADANFKLSTLSETKTIIPEIDKKLKIPSIEQILKILMQREESVTPNSEELIEFSDEFVNNSPMEEFENESIDSGKEPVDESEQSTNKTANESIESEAKSVNESIETETVDESVHKSANKPVALFKSFEMFHSIESRKETIDAIASESIEFGKECDTGSYEESTNTTVNEFIEPEERSETSFEIAENDTTIYLDDSDNESIEPEVKSETSFEIAENDTTIYVDESASESVYESGKESLDESFEIMDISDITIDESAKGWTINESMNSESKSVIESKNKSINATTNESKESIDESFEIMDISGKTNDDCKQ